MGSTARQVRDLLLTVIAGAALVVAGTVGYALAGPPSPGTDSAEAGFARDMTAHHRQAVLMSDLVRDRTRDPEIRFLAYDISTGSRLRWG